jgi:hypothetical protein
MREMTPDFDPRIAEWLEDDPDRAPSIVLEALTRALPAIPQRRRWLPMPRANELFGLAMAAVVLVVVAVGIGVWLGRNASPGGPTVTVTPAATVPATPTPASTSTPAAELKSITSPTHGWTAEIPTTWRLRAATQEWPPNTYPVPGAAYTDNLEPETSDGFPAFDVNVRALEPGETREEFLAFMTAANEEDGVEVLDEGEVVVDGETGRIQRQRLPFYGGWEVIVFHEGRAYVIYWVDGELRLDERAVIFNQILSSFRFPA